MDYEFLRDLAILLFTAKIMGLLARRLGAPQVVGEILAGLLLGPALLDLVEMSDMLSDFAELGVIFMMFSTGLGTKPADLRRTGVSATAIAAVGVLLPLVGGTLLYECFFGFSPVGTEDFYRALFIGMIMTATSVSITVAALKELGKLNTLMGTTIVSAAVIDDIMGILLLTSVISISTGRGSSILGVLLRTALFFVFAIAAGFVVNKLIGFIDKRSPHTQRIPIISISFCLLMAYLSEELFGIADITGAYFAGVALASVNDADYIERRVNIGDYLFFTPIFLAGVGLRTQLSGLTPTLLLFSLCFVLVALITKVIGCGLTAKCFGFPKQEALQIGIGMMNRGEVALIVAQKGLACGMFDQKYFTAVILLILISSIATPLALRDGANVSRSAL